MIRKKMPTIALIITSIILAFCLYGSRQEVRRLRNEMAREASLAANGHAAPSDIATVDSSPSVTQGVALVSSDADATGPEAKPPEKSNRRIMSDMAKAIEENPTINKMVEASQRGAIGALYSDMIEYLGLNADEAQYFMDVLMYRQMANVDAHLKMMSGDLTEEEKQALMEKAQRANEVAQEEMEKFLNNPDDFAEFKFYEDTIGERMMLSQMDQTLGEAALSDETYRQVLEIMHDERANFDFSTDLHDEENRDLSASRFSQENIQKHLEDMKMLGEQMDKSLQGILTPEQLAAWRESGEAMMQMQAGQLYQAGQMFGSE